MKLMTKVAAAAAILGLSGVASAASVINTLFPGFQQLSDNSAEYLIKADGSDSTIISVGDRLAGIFTIETVEQMGSTRFLGGGSGNNELTGIFDATVVAINGGPGNFQFVFAPSPAFEGIWGAGAVLAMFDDPSNDYQRVAGNGLNTIAQLTATATNGTHVITGAMDTASTFWVATSFTNDIAVVGSIPAPGNGGLFNVGLNFSFTAPGYDFIQVPCFNPLTVSVVQVDTCGSGSLLGVGGVTTPFQSFNNIDFTVNRIPEPGSIALMAGALIGAGVVSRRVQRRK